MSKKYKSLADGVLGGQSPRSVVLPRQSPGAGRLPAKAEPVAPGGVEPLEGRAYLSAVFQPTRTDLPQSGPLDVKSGDFNADGIPDLAVTNFLNNNITILMGTGGGKFKTAATFTTGSFPAGIGVADVNGDAKYDLIVANNTANTFQVFLGQGNGTFRLASTVQTPAQPAGVFTGDYNGDGKADVFISYKTFGTVQLGNGDGTFGPASTVSIAPVAGSLDGADFNPQTDVAISDDGSPNANAGTVTILRGNGDGTFQPAVTALSGLNFPVGAALGDFNGDGKTDIAVGLNADHEVEVFLGTGGLHFQPGGTFALPGAPSSAYAADLNGDGQADVAVPSARGNLLSLLFATGGTGLAARLTTPDQSFNAAAGDGSGTVAAPFALTRSSGQFDNSVLGVGSPAVASGGHGFGAVLYNADGSVRWQAEADFGAGNDAVAAAATLLPDGKALVLGTVTNAAGIRRLALARFDADGSPDATFGPNGELVGPLLSLTTQVKNLAVQADGKIVVVGQSGSDLAVWRYLPTLAPDTTFGRNGSAGVRFGTKAAPQTSLGTAVGLQASGDIVVGGGVFPTAGTENFALARFTAAGKLDTTFGTAGTVSTRVSGREEVGDLKVSASGAITVVGGGRSNLAFARYTANGVLDTTFGAGGTLVPSVAKAVARLKPDSVNAGLLGLMYDGHLLQTQGSDLKKSAGLTADMAPPAAAPYRVGSPAAGPAPFVFRVQYADNKAVNAATISSQNVFVTGPGGYKQSAGLKALTSSRDGSTRIAYYSVPAPRGGWTAAADGAYNIVLRANQVADTSGNYAAAHTVGAFTVRLAASLAAAEAVPGTVVPAGVGFSRTAVAAPLPWDESADVLEG